MPLTPLPKRLQWEDVRYFLAVAQAGSLSAAARRLDVEHSTVGRRVDALEQALGLRLFDRLPRGWQLTGEGEELLAQARRMEDEALAFERAAVGVTALSGSVRVSVPPSLGSAFLVPRLARAAPRWNAMTLEVIGETREINLSRREADLALRLGRPEAPGLVVRALGRIGYGLYGQADYLRRDPVDWEFVGYDDSLRRVPQQEWLGRYAGSRRFVLRTNDLLSLTAAAAAGLGVTVIPHYLARTDPSLHLADAAAAPPERDIWLVSHPDVRRSPRVRAVAELIVELFDAEQDWLARGERRPAA
jgi:DNA-binding transcriptional LysR family regulator